MHEPPAQGPLAGVQVIDASTVLAGPLACQILGDYGADVIKVEHPRRPDALRDHGPSRAGKGLWWTTTGRNKRCIGIDLAKTEGAELFCRLVGTADIVVENFRPGTMERWDLGYDRLREANPDVILVRVSGFGQFGPYARRPGYGTLAEAMSGFAAVTGEADGPPTLPPLGLADSICGISTACAAVMALYHRDARRGRGQTIDISILEPIITALGPQPIVYDQLGEVPPRLGNRLTFNAPRNTYRTRDGKWVAVSTSGTPVATRVMRLVGHPEVVDEAWFQTGRGRASRGEMLDRYVAEWVAERAQDEVVAAFEAADAAIAPVYDIAELMDDPQIRALDTITTVEDDDLGPVRMQNVIWRMSGTPGSIRFTGRDHGADTDTILDELGVGEVERRQLRDRGVIR